MKTKIVLLIAFNFLVAHSVSALTPPFSPEMLKDEADVIVVAKVTQVEDTPEKEDNNCVTLQGKKATLQVEKVQKGAPPKTLYLYWKHVVTTKNSCIYEPNDFDHVLGERAQYYLNCEKDQCRVVHWDGVKPIK